MAKTRRMAKKTEAWWLTDGTEACPACSQSYAYQTEIRCTDCDGPLCPICVEVTTTFEFSCPGCFAGVESRQTKNPQSEVSE